VLAQPGRHRRGRHVHPAAHHDVVEPAEHLQPSVLVQPRGVRRQEPAVHEDLGGERRIAVVAVEQHRPADPQAPVPVDRERHPVQRVAVVDAPARRLRRPVRRDHADPLGVGTPAQRGVDRPAAEQDRAERPQRGQVRARVEHPVQLGGHQGDEPVRAQGRSGRRERAVLLEQHRLVAGDQ
jgi:hypothetical protein